MLALIKWLNPAYPLFKLFGPVVRRPERSLAIVGKPVANASTALLQRNKETVQFQIEGEIAGVVTVTVPYDEETLNKMLAISLLPQVALLTTAYSIPSLQRDLNKIWRTVTVGKGGNLPRWTYSRDLLGRKIATEAAETAGKKATERALARGVSVRLAARIGANVSSRVMGSLIAGVNVLIWIDTAILATTGIADLLIPEEMEEGLGVDIQMWSPLDSVINALVNWTGEQLGITPEDIIRAGKKLGVDDLVTGGLLMVGDMVLDIERMTIESNLEYQGRSIDLDLDGYTFGQVIALASQFAAVEESIRIGWSNPKELMELFFVALFSLLIIAFASQLFRKVRQYAT